MIHLLPIEYYGDDKTGWSGSIEDDGSAIEKLCGHKTHHCPFCGGYNLELCNTHTPAYWIECRDCGCELHDVESKGGHQGSKSAAARAHRASIRRVIEAWLKRA